jgi:CheY-like chemotaxis protein
MHIILCSDNPATRQIVHGSIDGAGQHWTTCESGMELLAAVGTLAADIVVLDLGTHGMGGPLLASAVRELAPDLPIVAVSASGSADARPVLQQGIPHVDLGEDSLGELVGVVAALSARRKLALGVGSR